MKQTGLGFDSFITHTQMSEKEQQNTMQSTNSIAIDACKMKTVAMPNEELQQKQRKKEVALSVSDMNPNKKKKPNMKYPLLTINHKPRFRDKINSCIMKGKAGNSIFVKDALGVEMPKRLENYDDIDLNEMEIYDKNIIESKHIFHVTRGSRRKKTTTFIAGKVARSECVKIGLQTLDKLVKMLKVGMDVKTDRNDCNNKVHLADAWLSYSYQNKQAKSMDFPESTDSSNIDSDTQTEGNIKMLVAFLKEKSEFVLNHMCDSQEYNDVLNLQNFSGDNQACNTQFFAWLNYCSAMHTDDDQMFSTISCFSSDIENHKNKILSHLVFPEYKFAVPMRHADVVVFDPTAKHCVTNARFPGCFIVSTYVTK